MRVRFFGLYFYFSVVRSTRFSRLVRFLISLHLVACYVSHGCSDPTRGLARGMGSIICLIWDYGLLVRKGTIVLLSVDDNYKSAS